MDCKEHCGIEQPEEEIIIKKAKGNVVCPECGESFDEEPRVSIGLKCGICAYGAERYNPDLNNDNNK